MIRPNAVIHLDTMPSIQLVTSFKASLIAEENRYDIGNLQNMSLSLLYECLSSVPVYIF